ncbi:MAG: class I SAM-dependent methyltransferase [Candidatus Cybelea sp.]
MKILEGSEFLRAWHARYPGAATLAFGYGRIVGERRSSYDLLVDDVAALSQVTTAIDLACGDGYLLALLARRLPSAQLIGIDMAPEELGVARDRALPERVRLLAARAEALPLTGASIEAVVCHMALMLFDDARTVVNELERVIRPGGIFATVLGPASGSSEFVARFGALLREAEATEKLPPLRVGDPATFTEDSLRGLFANGTWSDVRVDQFQLRFDGTDDQIRATLLSMYNVARLSDDGRTELTRRLKAEMLERRQASETTECVLGLRHLVAVRGDADRKPAGPTLGEGAWYRRITFRDHE